MIEDCDGSAKRFSQIRDLQSQIRNGLRLGLGLAKARDAVAGLPLAAFLEQRHALKALENVAFCAGSAGGAQAAML